MPLPILPVTVSISGGPVVPIYAEGIPGQSAGIIQIKVRVPDNIMKGPYSPVMVQMGKGSSQPATPGWQHTSPPVLKGQSFQFVPSPNRYGLPRISNCTSGHGG